MTSHPRTRGLTRRALLSHAVATVATVTVGANFILNGIQTPAESAYTSPTGARPN